MPVCSDCLHEICPTAASVCAQCGEVLPQASFTGSISLDENRKCAMCERAAPPFARALAFGAYEGRLQELIHLLKYERVTPAADLLAEMLTVPLAGCLSIAGEGALVVPVPLYRARHNERGFNQAESLATAALRKVRSMGLAAELAPRALVRNRQTISQTGLTRHQRRANVRGAFTVRDAAQVRGCAVVLVDDVMTTGTTAAECARVLLRAGASQVLVATVARVQRQREASLMKSSGSTQAIAIGTGA